MTCAYQARLPLLPLPLIEMKLRETGKIYWVVLHFSPSRRERGMFHTVLQATRLFKPESLMLQILASG